MEHQVADQSTDKFEKFVYKCNYEFCSFKTNRPDGFKLHVDETHKKILKSCENCGKAMTSSSLSRHKRNKTCIQKDITVTTDQICEMPIALINENVNAQQVQNDGILEVKEVKIETTFSLVTHTNGNVTLVHDGIDFGDFKLYLTTQNPNGKSVLNFFKITNTSNSIIFSSKQFNNKDSAMLSNIFENIIEVESIEEGIEKKNIEEEIEEGVEVYESMEQ